MKTFSIICLLGILVGCQTKDNTAIDITVMADRTDSTTIVKPSVSWILNLSGLDKLPNRSIDFRFQNIGSTDFNPVYTANLKQGSFLDNKLERKIITARFYKLIDTLFKTQNRKVYDYKTSSILKPLVAQLKRISTSKASEKIVILCSDVFEHSPLFSVYKNKGLQQVTNLSQEFIVGLQKELNVPRLEGVTLYILHHPDSVKNNELFTKMCNLYRKLFEPYGLKIRIGIDNSITL